MRKVVEDGEYVLWKYTPTLFRPLFGNMDQPSYTRRIRLLLEHLGKDSYKVYYLEVNGMLLEYNIFTQEGRRLKCKTRNDLVSGPSYVLPEHRGDGYIGILMKMVFKYCCKGYDDVYAWISKDNVASIKAYLKVGYDVNYGELKIVGKMRKLIQTPKGKGTNIIVRYKL